MTEADSEPRRRRTRRRLAAAFTDLRTRAALTFTAPGAEQVYRAVRERRARTLRLCVAAGVLAASGLLLAGTAAAARASAGAAGAGGHRRCVGPERTRPVRVLTGIRHGAGTVAQPAEAAEPPGPPGGQRPGSTPRPDLANLVRFLSQQKIAELRGSTLTLPSWPTGSRACPPGTYTFADGRVATGATDEIGRPFDYLMLFRGSLGIYADLDGVPGEEMVVPLACGFTEVQYELLVLKETPQGLRPLGYIPGLPAFDRFYPYGGGLVVELHNDPFGTVAEQRRRYGWDGSRFVQTHGPVSFPADLSPMFATSTCGSPTFSSASAAAACCPFWTVSAARGHLPTGTSPARPPRRPASCSATSRPACCGSRRSPPRW